MSKIISIAHQKGGVGKSTIAFNLAVMLKANSIDLDVQETMTYLNDLRGSHGLKKLNVKKLQNTKQLKDYLQKYNEKCPLIIDCGGFDSDMNRVAISLSDLVITPVSEERIELMGLKKFQNIIEKISEIIGRKIPAYVVFNKIDPRLKKTSELEEFILKSGVFRLFKSKIRRRSEISISTPNGVAISEVDKKLKSSIAFLNLLKEIKKLLNIL